MLKTGVVVVVGLRSLTAAWGVSIIPVQNQDSPIILSLYPNYRSEKTGKLLTYSTVAYFETQIAYKQKMCSGSSSTVASNIIYGYVHSAQWAVTSLMQ